MAGAGTPLPFEEPARWTGADDDDLAAVRRCLSGDLGGFATLMARHQERLMATAYHLLRHPDDAADAVQESFLRAYRGLESYDETRRFGAWLGRITVNVCLSALRARRDRPLPAEGEWAAGAHDGGYLRIEQGMVLRAALEHVTPQDRALLLLRHVHGLTSAEIGESLGLPSATVRTRLARARQIVRAALPELGDLIDPDGTDTFIHTISSPAGGEGHS